MGGDGTTTHDSLTADICCSVSADGLNAPRPANGVKNITVAIGSAPASNTASVSKGPLIHNGMSTTKNTEVNMMEHISHKSISHSYDSSAPKQWQMANRRSQFDSREGNIKNRSNVAESSEYVKNVAETPVDTQSAEAKPNEDVLTRNKNSRRDTAVGRPASPPVFEKNTSLVSSVHKMHVPCIVINSSTVPAQVTSVTGVTVGSIMIEDVLASANQECAAAGKEIHDITNSLSRPQQIKNSGNNQHGALPADNPLWNDSVMRKPDKQPSKKERHGEGSANSMAVAAPTRPSENHSIVWENVGPTKSTEIDWYAHKPVHKELHQQNLGQMSPAENHTLSYDIWGKSNLETKGGDKEALADFNATKAEVATELGNWLDRKTSWDHEGRPRASWKQKSTGGLAPVVRNLAEPAGYLNVVDVVRESSDQWRQVEEQFESKTHNATEDRSKPTQTVPMPSGTWEPLSVNTWERLRASDNPRHYHIERQRNVGSNYAYKERVGRGCFVRETPAPCRACWIPKYTCRPQSNAQDNGVSEWLWDSLQGISDMDNSQGFDSKQIPQIVDKDGEKDLKGGQVNAGMSLEDENLMMIWNEKEWEYQQLYPAPLHHGQHDHTHHRDSRCRYSGGGRGAGKPTYNTNEDRQTGRRRHSEYRSGLAGTCDAAPDIQVDDGANDHRNKGCLSS